MINDLQKKYPDLTLLDPFTEIPDRFLDGSPEPPEKMIEFLNEYIHAHFFVACPFKATSEQKEQQATNAGECDLLKKQILGFRYTGSLVMLLFGFAALVSINPNAEDSYNRLQVSFNRLANAVLVERRETA